MFIDHIEKYHVYRNANGTTIAVARFAKKPVRGYAKCSPSDTYDESVGEDLAVLRCAEKINAKRKKNAVRKLADAKAALDKAQTHYDTMQAYLKEAEAETVEIANAKAKLYDRLK